MWSGEQETNIYNYSVPSTSHCFTYIISVNPQNNSILQMRFEEIK